MDENNFEVGLELLGDLAHVLSKTDVEYTLIGGAAIMVHATKAGEQYRVTRDFDFFIRKSEENFVKIAEALYEFGLIPKETVLEELNLNRDSDIYKGVTFESVRHEGLLLDVLFELGDNNIDTVDYTTVDISGYPIRVAEAPVIYNMKRILIESGFGGREHKDPIDLEILGRILGRDTEDTKIKGFGLMRLFGRKDK